MDKVSYYINLHYFINYMNQYQVVVLIQLIILSTA